jgi:lipopolysaccharide biosynthesis regulator YciM
VTSGNPADETAAESRQPDPSDPDSAPSSRLAEYQTPLADKEQWDVRLGNAELKLRLDGPDPYVEAELSALLAKAIAAGDNVATTRARIALGMAAARRSDHAVVIDLLSDVVASALIAPLEHATVYKTLAHSLTELGRHQEAIELLGDCIRSLDDGDPRSSAAKVRLQTRANSEPPKPWSTRLSLGQTPSTTHMRAFEHIGRSLV